MRKILPTLLTIIILQPITVSAITDIYGNTLPFIMDIPSDWVKSPKETIFEKNKVSHPAQTLQAFKPEGSLFPELHIFDTNIKDCIICNIGSIKQAREVLKASRSVGLSATIEYFAKYPSKDKSYAQSHLDEDNKILYLKSIQKITEDDYLLGTQVIFLRKKENVVIGFISNIKTAKEDNILLEQIISSVEIDKDNGAITKDDISDYTLVKKSSWLKKRSAELAAYGLIVLLFIIGSFIYGLIMKER